MGLWVLYFVTKLYLYFSDQLRLLYFYNLILIIFFSLSIPPSWRYRALLAFSRHVVGAAAAFALLWHESWLPPFWYSLKFAVGDSAPALEYIWGFISGAIHWQSVASLAALWGATLVLQRHFKLTPVILALMLVEPIRAASDHRKNGIADEVDGFYETEARRKITFRDIRSSGPDFDVIIFHVCSLSWDDLAAAGLSAEPFWRQFDAVLTAFNSVTSYSTPAALRLLRANCGQPRHGDLYTEAPADCYLLDNLRAQGYATYAAYDHDGNYGDFAQTVKRHAHGDAPLSPQGLKPLQRTFDGRPLYDSREILSRWWKKRQESGEKKAALYYNVTALHGGTHDPSESAWWKKDRPQQYRRSFRRLASDVAFLSRLVSASGRRAVLLFVSEHGMALRGSPLQPPDLRDIPLPRITAVPAAVKFVGPGLPAVPAVTRRISAPTSYLALAHWLGEFIKNSPFAGKPRILVEPWTDVPRTEFLAENQTSVVRKKHDSYFLSAKGKDWTKITEASGGFPRVPSI